MNEYELRTMKPAERDEVARLIYRSTNVWYESHGGQAIFTGDPLTPRLFCDVYEALDPNCCILVVE